MPRSEELARAVKNLQWLVGSVERFYSSKGKLGRAAIENMMRRTIPVEDDDTKPRQECVDDMSLRNKFPKAADGVTDMHAPATYNAWILSGEPENIYMRGTPTVVRVSVDSIGGHKAAIKMLQESLPFSMELNVPGGDLVAEAGAGGVRHVSGELDPELRLSGGHAASFIIPEGERLTLKITAGQQPAEFSISTRLETNRENGLSADEKNISEQVLRLRPGESRSFLIAGRKPVEAE